MNASDIIEAIRLTLEENAHLADGDVCTLSRLKTALQPNAALTGAEGVRAEGAVIRGDGK